MTLNVRYKSNWFLYSTKCKTYETIFALIVMGGVPYVLQKIIYGIPCFYEANTLPNLYDSITTGDWNMECNFLPVSENNEVTSKKLLSIGNYTTSVLVFL